MIDTRRVGAVFGTAATVILGVALTASGRGFRGGPGPEDGPGFRGPRPGGLLQQLVFPCRAGCFDTARTCHEAAESAAVDCGQQTCDAPIQAARAACQTDVTSDACATARTALASCLSPCVSAAETAFSSCRDAVEGCLATCGET